MIAQHEIGGVICGRPYPLPRLRRVLPRLGGGELALSLVWAAMTAWLLTACGPASAASPGATAMAAGYSAKNLAGGKLSSLPTGKLFIRVTRFAQPAGHSFPSQTHVAGFDYVASGAQRLIIGGRPPIEIAPGQSVFQPSIAHVHTNPGTSPNQWYFIALWSEEDRAKALVDPKVATVAFETDDLPPDALPHGSYVQTLRLVDLEPGGRSAAHRYGGVEAQFVLEGSISVHVAGQRPGKLGTGEGAYHLAGAELQEHNAGAERARFMELLTTEEGRPFQTSVDHAP